MKKIRIICAALAITAIGAFGGVAMAAETQADQAPAVATVEQQAAYAQPLYGYAEVVELASAETQYDYLVIKPEEGDFAGREIQLNISDDSLIMSNKDTKRLRLEDIKVGDRVYVYYDQAMTRSLPPQSHMYMLLTDVDEGTPARLWTAEKVETADNGDTVITTDNGGLLVRVPQKVWQLPNDANNAEAGDIKVGDRFIAWYDIVALSYPGQARADRAIVLPVAPTATEDAEAADKDFAPNLAASVVRVQATVKEVQLTGEDKYLLVDRGNEQGELRLNLATEGENAVLVVNAQTGQAADLSSIKPGDKVLVGHAMATTFSLPPQSWLHYVLVNVEENAPAGLFTVEQVQDGRLLVDNGGLWIGLPEGYAGEELKVGDTFLAWYDIVLESYPGQTKASKVTLVQSDKLTCGLPLAQELPQVKQTAGASNLVLDDMVFGGKVHYTNGVAMVPLRVVAEELGFEVEWDAETQSVYLDNGKLRTNVYVGADIYNILNADGERVFEHISFGAPAEWHDYGICAPADLFSRLGAEVSVSGDTMTIK